MLATRRNHRPRQYLKTYATLSVQRHWGNVHSMTLHGPRRKLVRGRREAGIFRAEIPTPDCRKLMYFWLPASNDAPPSKWSHTAPTFYIPAHLETRSTVPAVAHPSW